MTVGMIRPDKGRVFLGEEDITQYPMYIRARKGIGYLPQESSIFKKLTVEENITAILEVLPGNGVQIQSKALDLMQELGIQTLARQKAASLSGGERRRLEIARVLATDPLFIGVLISDHNVRETLGVCHHAYIMSQGMVIESGPPDRIISSAIAKKTYLGDNFRL
jgi:lipopolysaccharide export system ATP-binding protein